MPNREAMPRPPSLLRLLPWALVALLALRGLWGGAVAQLPWLHVAVALATAALAGVSSRLIVRRRTGSARDAAFATGAAVLAGALVVHAAATPGAVFGPNQLVGVSGLASVMLLAGCAGGAVLLPRAARARRPRLLAVAASVSVACGLVVAASIPGLLERAPSSVPLGMLALLVPAAATLAAVGRFARRWFGTPAAGCASLEAGCTLLGVSLLMHYGPPWTAAFWLSHAFEAAGAALLALGCARAFAPPLADVVVLRPAGEATTPRRVRRRDVAA